MPYLTGGQAVVAALRAHGVDTIFGIPGVHTLPLYDAILDEPGLRHVLARHEQGVGYMADGYFNDATYTAVKQQQARRFHRRYIATDLQAPDYVMMAQAFGIASTRVSTPGGLEDALAQAIQRGGASLIEVTLPSLEW